MKSDAGFVYLIGCGNDLVKIGFSRHPEQRLAELQTANGQRLRLLAVLPGTEADERAIHAKFADRKAWGEWFTLDEELRAFARGLGAALDNPILLTIAEAAPILRRSVSGVRKMLRFRSVRRRPPALRVGGRIFFDRGQLEAWIRAQVIESPSSTRRAPRSAAGVRARLERIADEVRA